MSNNTAVVAPVERGGKVRAFPVPRVTAERVREAIVENVEQSTRLMTDQSLLYLGIGAQMGGHEFVKHSIDEYARGECHTNTWKASSRC